MDKREANQRDGGGNSLRIVLEPCGRQTGPRMKPGLACLYLVKRLKDGSRKASESGCVEFGIQRRVAVPTSPEPQASNPTKLTFSCFLASV